MSKKYSHGEWLGLTTDGSFNFIKGHVNHEEAEKIANEALREEKKDPELNATIEAVRHFNGRFGLGYDDHGELQRHLYLHRPMGERGSFPVTEVEYSLNIY